MSDPAQAALGEDGYHHICIEDDLFVDLCIAKFGPDIQVEWGLIDAQGIYTPTIREVTWLEQ